MWSDLPLRQGGCRCILSRLAQAKPRLAMGRAAHHSQQKCYYWRHRSRIAWSYCSHELKRGRLLAWSHHSGLQTDTQDECCCCRHRFRWTGLATQRANLAGKRHLKARRSEQAWSQSSSEYSSWCQGISRSKRKAKESVIRPWQSLYCILWGCELLHRMKSDLKSCLALCYRIIIHSLLLRIKYRLLNMPRPWHDHVENLMAIIQQCIID